MCSIGWAFERNYAVDYDFATMLAKLTTNHDCVIVFIGDNATYGKYVTENKVTNGIITQDTEYIRNLYQEMSREHRI